MKGFFVFAFLGVSLIASARQTTCANLIGETSLTYDYVIIGAGPGGGPLAARLAAAGYSVFLADAGGAEQPLVSKVPALHAVASEDLPIDLDYGVAHYSDPAKARRDSKFDEGLNGILYPRGEGIGGGALVNAMITVLPHRGDFDRLGALLGDAYWSDKTMWRIWSEKIEDCRYRPGLRAAHRIGKCLGLKFLQNIGGHGFEGWLTTNQPRLSLAAKILWSDPQLRKILLTAEGAARGLPGGITHYLARLMTKFDRNDRRSISRHEAGLVLTPQAIDDKGRRNGARSLILKTESEFPENLHIVTQALGDRVVFEGKRAVGVEFVARDNGLGADDEPHGPIKGRVTVKARREVIVSGGTFETPALLMRSGIGPAEELARLGITPVVHNEHVGRHLHDRYEVGVISRAARPFDLLRGATFSTDPSDPFFQQWQQGEGLYATNGALIAFTARSHPSRVDPDLYIFGLPAGFRGYERGYSKKITHDPREFTWAVLVARTQNRAGLVTLRSSDPSDTPIIDFRYFEQGALSDEQALLAGVEIVRKLNARMPKGLFTTEVSPGASAKAAKEITDWVRRESWGHHAVGTAALGTVLDSRFRVKETEGLRVVDASIFPDIPGYFVASAVYLVSEMAAERILEGI